MWEWVWAILKIAIPVIGGFLLGRWVRNHSDDDDDDDDSGELQEIEEILPENA